LDRHPVRRVIP